MFFNSIDFAVFLPTVFLLYWFFKEKIRAQNLVIVLASYVFYGWWDWRFLFLILLSTVIDYACANQMITARSKKERKIFLFVSIFSNLGILGFFKYFNFFLDSIAEVFSFWGLPIQGNGLNIILPVGISFYTFQTLSYSIDVYKNKITPTKDILAFASFVCFFPQLVAGPIERATHLLPQFLKKRNFEITNAYLGIRQIMWGLFCKMVIADNCAQYANYSFDNYDSQSGSTLLLGVIFFAFQIYGDFSGYSHIAIGVSKIFGFDLRQNFAYPYFSRDIAEFWRRWHISLSTWFRDYLYIPLGGSRGNVWSRIRNIFIIFILSGLWHGANWTFVIWGLLNALYFLPLLLLNKNRVHLHPIQSGMFPNIKTFTSIVFTFFLTCFAWIFFRADSLDHAMHYITNLFSRSLFKTPFIDLNALITFCFLIVFIALEWFGRKNLFAIEQIGQEWPKWLKWSAAYFFTMVILLFSGKDQTFIYFQF